MMVCKMEMFERRRRGGKNKVRDRREGKDLLNIRIT
jgi:hypothetical protein